MMCNLIVPRHQTLASNPVNQQSKQCSMPQHALVSLPAGYPGCTPAARVSA